MLMKVRNGIKRYLVAKERTEETNLLYVLEDENGEIFICPHKWGEHEHPTMVNLNIISENGLILYYKTDSLDRHTLRYGA